MTWQKTGHLYKNVYGGVYYKLTSPSHFGGLLWPGIDDRNRLNQRELDSFTVTIYTVTQSDSFDMPMLV